MRIQGQNEKSISVIIGNPPYNASATLWGDGGANRQYPELTGVSGHLHRRRHGAKTSQYDMYKRFIRWASDRLTDDGIIGVVTNRRYLDAQQDDGFRQIAAQEFTDIYILDLGSDVRRNPKISGTTHNVFGIQTGVAVGLFVREQVKLGECNIHYARREDPELAIDKLAYLRVARLEDIPFQNIEPDGNSNWLNQSNSDFGSLLPTVNKTTMRARVGEDEQAVFKLYAPGVMTGRDEWVYDFEVHNLRNKALFFADIYNGLLAKENQTHDAVIKWSRDLRNEFRRGKRIVYSEAERIQSLYRPFTAKWYCANFVMNDVLTRNHYAMFGPDLNQENNIIFIKGPAAESFSVLATEKLSTTNAGLLATVAHSASPSTATPRTASGSATSPSGGLRQFREHYRDDSISAEDIFAYTYAVLHNPVYREKYALDLKREFPRLPFYPDFRAWVDMGQELLDLHTGFESVEAYPLQRTELAGEAKRAILRADKERSVIALDEKTSLTGVPPDAWRYRLGSRSALEWVLDQYKERKPKDPTIAEKFNTYRFADYKDQVIDLLQRVCAVSVRTMEIVDGMAKE